MGYKITLEIAEAAAILGNDEEAYQQLVLFFNRYVDNKFDGISKTCAIAQITSPYKFLALAFEACASENNLYCRESHLIQTVNAICSMREQHHGNGEFLELVKIAHAKMMELPKTNIKMLGRIAETQAFIQPEQACHIFEQLFPKAKKRIEFDEIILAMCRVIEEGNDLRQIIQLAKLALEQQPPLEAPVIRPANTLHCIAWNGNINLPINIKSEVMKAVHKNLVKYQDRENISDEILNDEIYKNAAKVNQ
ncbi:MAG: hypothetical protein H0V82_13115 [Candidatus Protochlamydia sp.]|nr:hypothetical protein [Candidatus Protochlamydia sp.]